MTDSHKLDFYGTDIPFRTAAAQLSDVFALSVFAAETNAVRSLAQTFCSTRRATIEAELREAISFGLAFVGFEGTRIVGLASACLGHPQGNADIVLLISSSRKRYDEVAHSLFQRLRAAIDPGVRCTFYFPKENDRCGAFLASIGAKRSVNEYQLAIVRDDFRPIETKGVFPLRPMDAGEFMGLYDAIFPEIYVTVREILEDLEGRHRVFVAKDESGMVALAVLRLNGGQTATAEVIGVRADRRGRGHGRTILSHLVREAFSTHGAERVDLIVDLDNESAIRLYTDLGFRVEREHVCCHLDGRSA